MLLDNLWDRPMRPVLGSAHVFGELPDGAAELGLSGPVASTAWHL
jgi:hypothetical protein